MHLVNIVICSQVIWCFVLGDLKSAINEETENDDNLELLLQEIMVQNLVPYKCVVIMMDSVYNEMFQRSWFKRFGLFISFVMINVDDSQDLLSPYVETQEALSLAKKEGCQLYIILVANGLQVSRLLRFGDRYRAINTRAQFIMLFDNRLFDKSLFYLWRRIVNVIFVRQYGGQKTSGSKKSLPWFEITTVPFPSPITSVFVPNRLNIWAKKGFRKAVELFRDKTSDLRNQTLKVAAFAHIPGTSKISINQKNTVRAILGSMNYSGVEIEILRTVSNSMNFYTELYEAENADNELWGRKHSDGKYSGLIGEMVSTHADIALGDLYYTTYILDLMDLSLPYNTECLTFLTPESLYDVSWKTLILPFKPGMWGGVFVCLLVCGIVFYSLARFYERIDTAKKKQRSPVTIFTKRKKIITLTMFPDIEKINPADKYWKMKEKYNPAKPEGQAIGLYQFSQPVNSILYTYSMLLLVSLPKLPTGWSLRMLTGWYWLYCLLLVVAYRASMTAILSQPTPRVTIDTLQELQASRLRCGGLGDLNNEFFTSSLDPSLKAIGENFELVNDSITAVDRVAKGLFAFYDNTYFLKEALVKRETYYDDTRSGNRSMDEQKTVSVDDRNLHIMTDCVIKMPVSIGLQKNSPIKPRVDKIIRKMLEAGLIKKWLDDVMLTILSAEIHTRREGAKALMNMKKFFGAIVALLIGYSVGTVCLIIEIVHFHVVVKKNPNYNKYSRTVQLARKM